MMKRGMSSTLHVCSVVFLLVACTLSLVHAIPSPPAPCGTLDLTNMLTQHCFPEDGESYRVELSVRAAVGKTGVPRTGPVQLGLARATSLAWHHIYSRMPFLC